MEIDAFLTDTQTIGHIPQHIRAFSGRSTLGKFDGSVTGVECFYCPPITAEKMAMTIRMDVLPYNISIFDHASTGHGIGFQIKLLQEKWHPSYIWRKGIFHEHMESGQELTLQMETWAVPSAVDDSFYLKIRIQNLSAQSVSLKIHPEWHELCFEDASGKEWGWNPPSTDVSAEHISDGLYQGRKLYLSLLWSGMNERADIARMDLAVNETKEIILKALFSATPVIPVQNGLFAEFARSLHIREQKWTDFWNSVPHLLSSHKKLEKSYIHSLLVLFLIKWESPHFITSPFYAEAGLAGRSVCSYMWGESYISKVMMLSAGTDFKKNILLYLKMGLDKHYAVDPITGEGIGPCYHYNLFSIVTVIRDYVQFTGDVSFLEEQIDGVPLYRLLITLVEENESKLPHDGALIDYGNHHNLLEMRGSGYEHIVPSPNGERVIIYRFLDELLNRFGCGEEALKYREKAENVCRDLTAQLWDNNAGWFCCKYPDGHKEMVYSIQIFDLLANGILTPDQEKAVVSHINDNEFLSEYGVHSISKADDLHYDLGDVDWGGAGAYSGDPCNLIETLYKMGQSGIAWDITRRLLWWADYYPYTPQSVWAGKRDYSHWETPICKCAVSFAQAVLFGMLGMQVGNGTVSFAPQLPDDIDFIQVTNVKAFGKTYEYCKEEII